MAALETSARTLGDVVVVQCKGKIVLGEETANLRQLMKEVMGSSPHIVLDLTAVHHIDSNGIGMLVGLHIAAKKAGACIKLAGLVDHVKSVMEITRLSTLFDVYATAEEAIASFAPAVPAR